jgi:pimeloyl-CoA synthetase
MEQNESCERLLIGKVTENCIHLLEAEPGSGIDTCLQSRDTNDFVDIKVEDMTDTHEEENPLRVECPVIKSELEITHTQTRFILPDYTAKTKVCTEPKTINKNCSAIEKAATVPQT